MSAATRRDVLVSVLSAAVVAVVVALSGAASATPAEPHVLGHVDALAVLVSDPEPGFYSTRALVEVDGERFSLEASGGAAPALLERLSGERIAVRGEIRPLPDGLSWLRRQGVVGVLSIDTIRWWTRGSPATRWANALRRTLAAGTASLSPDQQSLFAGFVLGDDRFQRDLLTDDFRAAGLGHLLAVSGSNVAFLLALVAPLIARLDIVHRVPCILVVLAFFALLTRAEPSVLRATVMAGTAAVLAGLGRPSNGRRLLAVAAAGLVVVSPGLAFSLGFQLSVLASAGIVWMSPAIAAFIRGPAPLANAIAVTCAAQLWVSPLLVATFGGVPVAALPANLAAAPMAGPISGWGLTGGWIAGIVGGRVAAILHLPTQGMLAWVQFVARLGARAPLGELRAGAVALLIAALVIGLVGRVTGRRRRVLGVAVAVVLLAPTFNARVSQPSLIATPGVEVWRSGGGVVLVVTDGARPATSLEAVRRANVGQVGAVVLESSHPQSRDTARALTERYRPTIQWTLRAPGYGEMAPVGSSAVVGSLAVLVVLEDGEPTATVRQPP